MEKVILSQDEFVSLREEQTEHGFDNRIYAHAFNIIKKYGSQNKYFELDFDSGLDEASKNVYESFGIYVDSSRLARDMDNRMFVLIVDPSWESDFEEKCREFIKENFPEGESPDFFVVDKKMESFDEIVYWNNKVTSIFPESWAMATNSSVKREHGKQEGMSELLEELELLGVGSIDISEQLFKLSDAYNNTNSNTLQTFFELEKSVLLRRKGKEILFSKDFSVKDMPVVAAYLYYKHNIIPHLGAIETSSFLTRLSSLLFDRNRMLAEDKINYIKKLPDLMLRFNEGFEFLVLLDKEGMSCNVTVSCIEADSPEESDVEKMKLDINKISLIPLLFEYDLKGMDGQSVKTEHDRLLSLYVTFENKLGMTDNTINVVNSFFFEVNGTKYLGYIENMDLKLPTIVYPVHNELSQVYIEMGLDDIPSLYPINVIPGHENYVKSFIRGLEKQDYKVRSLGVYKHSHALGVIVDYFNNRGPNLLNWSGMVDFVTLGLWWQETSKYRMYFLKDLAKMIDLREFRNKSKSISVFGGPHPMLRVPLEITEEFLKE